MILKILEKGSLARGLAIKESLKPSLLILTGLILGACSTMAPPQNPQGVHGVIALKSAHNVKITMDRLEAALKQASASVTARIDLADSSQRSNQSLRPTEVLLWNSAQAQAAMLNCTQTVGIDLPQKALVWQDQLGAVYLGWNDPVHLVTNRHETKGCETITRAMAKVILDLAKLAVE